MTRDSYIIDEQADASLRNIKRSVVRCLHITCYIMVLIKTVFDKDRDCLVSWYRCLDKEGSSYIELEDVDMDRLPDSDIPMSVLDISLDVMFGLPSRWRSREEDILVTKLTG